MDNQNPNLTPDPVIPPIEGKKNKAPLLLLAGMTVLLVAVGGVYLFLSGKAAKKEVLTAVKPTSSKQASPSAAPVTKWLTYENAEYNFAINYPANWEAREYPDTKNGAGFRPVGLGDDREPISLSVNNKTGNYIELPIEEYAKKGASVEIQNYNKLASIKKIVTTEGKTGYITTWMVQPIVGQPTEKDWKESTPITYFEIPNNKTVVLRVNLDDEKYAAIYEQMLKSLVITVSLTPEPTVDETAVLENVMKKYIALKNKSDESIFTVTVSEIDGNSAKGMVTADGGGGIWFGYKEDGAWRLVADGNGVVECASFSLYPEFSKKLLPECYDTATESIVTR